MAERYRRVVLQVALPPCALGEAGRMAAGGVGRMISARGGNEGARGAPGPPHKDQGRVQGRQRARGVGGREDNAAKACGRGGWRVCRMGRKAAARAGSLQRTGRKRPKGASGSATGGGSQTRRGIPATGGRPTAGGLRHTWAARPGRLWALGRTMSLQAIMR